jgi:integrase
MASFKKLPKNRVQIRITHRLLPKPLYATFDAEEPARAYAAHLEALLAHGIVPSGLLERTEARKDIWSVVRCIVEYRKANAVPASDALLLDTLRGKMAQVSTGEMTYAWAEAWILSMKRQENLAPSTIRHRHGALARCFDWMVRKHGDILPQNPLRLLKRGFASYNEEDERILSRRGLSARIDEERDRRVLPHEEALIRKVLAGRSRDDLLLFDIAIESGMRMRECYTLELPQVSLEQRTAFLSRTKNGDRRQVPLSSVLLAVLQEYIREHYQIIQQRSGRLFPYWNGDRSDEMFRRVTRDLSREFANVFAQAGHGDIHFHDLRHEFICRLYERTKLSDVQIARITGHRDPKQLRRYASLRGSDLAPHLW